MQHGAADLFPAGATGLSKTTDGRRAVIVGGSLAGLSAATWLRMHDWDVVVLERASGALEDHGAGIVLHPSTSRLLTEHEGITLDDFSVGVEHLRYIDLDGAVVAESPSGLRFSAYGALYRALRRALAGRGGTYRHGVTVVEASWSPTGAAVVDAAGERTTCDLVVGADGVRSTVRRLVDPLSGASPAGYVAWRGVLDEALLPPAALRPLAGAITYSILERSHVLTYPIRTAGDGRMLRNWVWYRNLTGPAQLDELLVDRDGSRHDLSVPAGSVRPDAIATLVADARRDLPPPVAMLVEGTDHPFVQVVVDVTPARMCVGRVCLVGDAGFVARPHAAAGTAKGAEEARLLARAVSPPGIDVPRTLAKWARDVEAMGRALVARSRLAGERAQLAGTWAVGEPLPFGLRRSGDSELYDSPLSGEGDPAG